MPASKKACTGIPPMTFRAKKDRQPLAFIFKVFSCFCVLILASKFDYLDSSISIVINCNKVGFLKMPKIKLKILVHIYVLRYDLKLI